MTIAFPAPSADKATLEHGDVFTPKFDSHGLIAAIVVDARSAQVLMFAWMNAEALARTIERREAHFYSRSRNRLWRKGEESGNTLRVVDLLTDCDQDALVVRVEIAGDGVACHTGAASCFYRQVDLGAEGTPKLALSERTK